MNAKVEAYLTEKKKSENTELSKAFGEIEELYTKKLWHQLTKKLSVLVKNPELQNPESTELVELYSSLISELENRINPLSLTELAGETIKQIKNPEEAIKFVEKLAPKVVDNAEAKVLCNVLIAQIVLNQLKDKQRTKKLLEETEQTLDDIEGVTEVHGRFYKLLSELYCQDGSHAEYYRSALRYLGCSDISHLDSQTKSDQAFYLGLAALLGNGIYNFGELLSHPILNSLEKTDREWLMNLLFAFNEGNISKFESMKPMWGSQPDLVAKETELREKIRLLCLMEMAFKRKSFDRQLTFSEIAREACLPVDQVEVMVMRALSKGLVKGTIDQVDQKVNITWVQPRVLDKNQLASMMERLNAWCEDVNSMQTLLEDHAQPILTL